VPRRKNNRPVLLSFRGIYSAPFSHLRFVSMPRTSSFVFFPSCSHVCLRDVLPVTFSIDAPMTYLCSSLHGSPPIVFSSDSASGLRSRQGFPFTFPPSSFPRQSSNGTLGAVLISSLDLLRKWTPRAQRKVFFPSFFLFSFAPRS